MVSRTDFDLYLETDRGLIKPCTYMGYVFLNHNENFKIVASNRSLFKVKAKFYLSGYNIGTLILKPLQTFSLERPVVGLNRIFQFVEFNTYEAFLGNVCQSNIYVDEVTVIFYPEDESLNTYENIHRFGLGCDVGINPQPDGVGYDTVDNSFISGGCVLGATRSNQSFTRYPNFDTRGKYCFSLLLRKKESDEKMSEIIPLSDLWFYYKNYIFISNQYELKTGIYSVDWWLWFKNSFCVCKQYMFK